MSDPIRTVTGCKVGWVVFATRADAEAWVEGVKAEAVKQADAGYDFGYCAPGQISKKETADGGHEYWLTTS